MQCPDCTTFHFLWCLRIASFGAVTVILGVAGEKRRALVLSNSEVIIYVANKGFSPLSQPAVKAAFKGLKHPRVKFV